MIKNNKSIILVWVILIFSVSKAQVRIKDIARIENSKTKSLIGYGLVTGLDGTGDKATRNYGSIFTVQSISNMLERFGVTIDKEKLRTRNVAAVMVTAEAPPFARVGTKFDVTVSSLGDATSLEGGVLLMTPLKTQQGKILGRAQGPLSIGGYNIETSGGEKVRKNHALTGRVPAGGVMTKRLQNGNQINLEQPVRYLLQQTDFVTAERIAKKINSTVGNGNEIARPLNSGVINVSFPDNVQSQADAVEFFASIDSLRVKPDVEARVVINERTGTVVAGSDVKISEVMISHGSLTIRVSNQPVVSQPAPMSEGQTVVMNQTTTKVKEEKAKTAAIRQTNSVQDLSAALNQMSLTPRDIIAIFQSIKKAGSLNAELIII